MKIKSNSKLNLFRMGSIVTLIFLVVFAISMFGYNLAIAEVPGEESTESISAIQDQGSDVVNSKTAETESNYTVSISGNVKDPQGSPVASANVMFFNESGSFIAEEISILDGSFKIENVQTTNLPGYLLIAHDSYETKQVPINESMVVAGVISLGNITIVPIQPFALYTAKGHEHHKSFHCVYVIKSESGEQRTDSLDVVEITSDTGISIPEGGTYSVDESGIMNIHFIDDNVDFSITVQPIGEDGYVVDKWITNGAELVIGQVYEVTSTNTFANFVSYKAAGATPQTENIPQTGDSLPFVVIAFSIIALFAGGLMFRKSLI